MADTFLCGVVEGFYGRPWTCEQRKSLFQRMGSWGMNVFMYAPKDDEKHRADWRFLYSLEEADELRALIGAAKAEKIHFLYALSPGLDIRFSSEDEVKTLRRKLEQLSQLGCRSFALLFDDIDEEMAEADSAVFESFAHAQAYITNAVYEQIGKPEIFLFCPTEYCESRANPSVAKSQYLSTIGTELNPAIKIMWTGPRVISKSITVESICQLSSVLKRPPVIWDNLHANDYDQRRLFLGPYVGRSSELYPHLGGVLTNPNCEFEPNFMAVNGLALWYRYGKAIASGRKSPTESMQVDSQRVDYDAIRSLRMGIQDWLAEFQKQTGSTGFKRKMVSGAAAAQIVKDGDEMPAVTDATEIMDVGSPSAGNSAAKRQRYPDGGKLKPEKLKLSEEDLMWIVDLFYLPHEHGERAEKLMREFHWLKAQANTASEEALPLAPSSKEVDGGEPIVSQSENWLMRAKVFRKDCKKVMDVFVRLTEIPNRSLLYDLYPYLWDVKEVVMLLDAYIAWLEDGCRQKKGRSVSYLPEDIEPWVFRGGIAADMQRLLPHLEGSGSDFSTAAPLEPSSRTFVIRPYRPEDEALVYKTCLVTGDAGNDATEKFSDHSSLLGDRYVGPYINLSAEFAFVVEDDEGVCGYVLGALDSKTFFVDYKAKWLPKILAKYPQSEKTESLTAPEELIASLHSEEPFLPPELYSSYPSHLHIDIMPRGQGSGVGKRMIRCLLSVLKTKGSDGVFLEMGSSNQRAYKFYQKLGFVEPPFKAGTVLPPGTKIMARKL